MGVPYKGKYKETFNSDNTIYGGQGNVNLRAKQSNPEQCDGREQSIRVTIPPLGIAVFQCTKARQEKKEKEGKKIEAGKEERKQELAKPQQKKRQGRKEKVSK